MALGKLDVSEPVVTHIPEFAGDALKSAPRERYRYTDVGFILLGEVAARADGKPLPELERELVFKIITAGSAGHYLPAPGRGSLLSPSAFGHTGFTGTSLWIDPEQNFYVILLTNRIHPTRDNQKIGPVRARLAAVRDLIRHTQTGTSSGRTPNNIRETIRLAGDCSGCE